MRRWNVLLARYLVSVYGCCLLRGLSSLLVSRSDVRKAIGLMRRFYNLSECKELLIACITDACLWIIHRINKTPNDELARRLQDYAYVYMTVVLHKAKAAQEKPMIILFGNRTE